MDRLAEKLAKVSFVALDTAVFIYQFEKNNNYFKLTKEIFSRLDQDAGFIAVTSIITLLEILVKPFKEVHTELAEQYTQKLLYDAKLTTWIINGDIPKKAAEIRAKYGVKTPDAIQIATAILAGAEMLITNDVEFKKIKEVETLILKEFL